MLTISSPAKINLFLAITGQRPDGFHNLVSLTSTLQLHDSIQFSISHSHGQDSLSSSNPSLPTDHSNLILKASSLFRSTTHIPYHFHAQLTKNIPTQAGLGGGSSNASSTLLALNSYFNHPLSLPQLSSLAAQIGSDCPLFLYPSPSLIHSRGEIVSPLPPTIASQISSTPILLLIPPFGIDTKSAYQSLRSLNAYTPPSSFEPQLSLLLQNQLPWQNLLFNSFEPTFFSQFPQALSLKNALSSHFNLSLHLSGSGSASFLINPPSHLLPSIANLASSFLGPQSFVIETSLFSNINIS